MKNLGRGSLSCVITIYSNAIIVHIQDHYKFILEYVKTNEVIMNGDSVICFYK